MSDIFFICGNLFLRIARKTAKITKIRMGKNLLPHVILREEECLLLKNSKNLLHVFSKLRYAYFHIVLKFAHVLVLVKCIHANTVIKICIKK